MKTVVECALVLSVVFVSFGVSRTGHSADLRPLLNEANSAISKGDCKLARMRIESLKKALKANGQDPGKHPTVKNLETKFSEAGCPKVIKPPKQGLAADDPYPRGELIKPVEFKSKSGVELMALPGGVFEMGSPSTEKDRYSNEDPVRQVSVSKFAIGVYEVTQSQYESVMKRNPSIFKGYDLPVEQVTWYDAVQFCNELSKLENLPPAYKINGTKVTWDRKAVGYRLPTEAEWEYAARAKTKTAYFFGESDAELKTYAWFDEGDSGSTHRVGQKDPSPWGLYDMYGNVWEWCWDWYAGSYDPKDVVDPRGPAKGETRLLRGGSFWVGPGAPSLGGPERELALALGRGLGLSYLPFHSRQH